jgi:hypothetical protein
LIDVDEENEPLFEVTAEAEFIDPRLVFEMSVAVPPIEVTTAGEFRLQLHACEQFVLERRITVIDGSQEETI